MNKASVTPMMAQFLEIKAEYKDALLFYRMGDFYEMFFEDAVAAAEALDIALTKRGKYMGNDIPMCGVPARAAEGYFLTLIRKGFRVAVCEQMEDPSEAKKRGSKSVVKREVVRLVTPGTLTEDSLLKARSHNYLAAYSEVRNEAAIAWVDISTGSFHVMKCPRVKLGPELARLSPSELLVSEQLEPELAELVTDFTISLTALPASCFDSTAAKKRVTDIFNIGTLDSFGQFTRAEISAMGAIVEWLEITQKGNMPLLSPPVCENPQGAMQIDAATRRNLELTQGLSGGREGSLISVIDRTLTAGGGRLLEKRLSSPSRDLTIIHSRLDALDFFYNNRSLAQSLRDNLRKCPDMERAISRLGLDRGSPRDLSALRDALEQSKIISTQLTKHDLPQILIEAAKLMSGHEAIQSLLNEALVENPPIMIRDGGFIASGYNPDLDEARTLRDEGRSVIAGMQAEYIKQTGITALKIKHNNVLGYFIETTATHAEKMLSAPLSETFIHRQTTANAVRFTTVPLSEMETKILNAGNRALEIEKRLFCSLTADVLATSKRISSAAQSLSEIDVSCAFADLASAENWTKPNVDNSHVFNIKQGRHPVVEHAIRKQSGAPFIANDCDLAIQDNQANIWLLTGPNMAGKSTFLRQNAIIALLAQIGSYVPASHAHIGLVSQLFSRVGASDDLARGRSTFMVEMVETAAILNQADDRALVILDEIGRGTATYDGLSIAWATLEHLHDVNKCRALFATHYHEMTALSNKLNGVENATVTVKEWEGDVIFLHEVKKGAADRSYGIQVAKLAGLPESVVVRARTVLKMLEKNERRGNAGQKSLIDDLPLFSATPVPTQEKAKTSIIEERLKEILPDEISPKDALALLYELKSLEI